MVTGEGHASLTAPEKLGKVDGRGKSGTEGGVGGGEAEAWQPM